VVKTQTSLVENVNEIYSSGVARSYWGRIMVAKRNLIAKDLRTPKYRMRVVPLVKMYNRKKEVAKFIREYKNGN